MPDPSHLPSQPAEPAARPARTDTGQGRPADHTVVPTTLATALAEHDDASRYAIGATPDTAPVLAAARNLVAYATDADRPTTADQIGEP